MKYRLTFLLSTTLLFSCQSKNIKEVTPEIQTENNPVSTNETAKIVPRIAARAGGCPEGPPCPKKPKIRAPKKIDSSKEKRPKSTTLLAKNSLKKRNKDLSEGKLFRLYTPPVVIFSGILGSKSFKLKRLTMKIQESLNSKSYYTGDIDGVANPETIKAISKFQLDNELQTDELGFINVETLLALEINKIYFSF